MVDKSILIFIGVVLLSVAGLCEQVRTEKCRLSVPSAPPGVVIDHLPSQTHDYVGSPSIAFVSDGHYVASHDIFGDGVGSRNGPNTLIFESVDSGRTWPRLAKLTPQFAGRFSHVRRFAIVSRHAG